MTNSEFYMTDNSAQASPFYMFIYDLGLGRGYIYCAILRKLLTCPFLFQLNYKSSLVSKVS